MAVGCLEYPGISTFGSQPLDLIVPPWLVQLRNPAMSPYRNWNEQVPITVEKEP